MFIYYSMYLIKSILLNSSLGTTPPVSHILKKNTYPNHALFPSVIPLLPFALTLILCTSSSIIRFRSSAISGSSARSEVSGPSRGPLRSPSPSKYATFSRILRCGGGSWGGKRGCEIYPNVTRDVRRRDSHHLLMGFMLPGLSRLAHSCTCRGSGGSVTLVTA